MSKSEIAKKRHMRDKHDKATKSTSPKNKKTKKCSGEGVSEDLAGGGEGQARISTLVGDTAGKGQEQGLAGSSCLN